MINKQPFSSVLSILTRLSKLEGCQHSQKYYGQHSTIRIKESADFSKSSMSLHNGVTFSGLIENIQFVIRKYNFQFNVDVSTQWGHFSVLIETNFEI